MSNANFGRKRIGLKFVHIVGSVALLLSAFQLAAAQTEKVRHSFSGGQDGYWPYSGLILYKGDFYGTTNLGGSFNAGTVFKVVPNGVETVIYSFTSERDGAIPGNLVIKDGNFYGTTGGAGPSGKGTVFKLTPSGTLTALYGFKGGADGEFPNGPMVVDNKGNLFGVAEGGTSGWGVVFKLTPSGKESVLYNFQGGTDGGQPNGGLATDSKRNVYGTAQSGGTAGGGVVFEVSSTGSEKVLHNFTDDGTDGYNPPSGLIRDQFGNLYGTTRSGGQEGWGTLYEVTASGTETVLASFSNSSIYSPEAPPIIDKEGNLYGTAAYTPGDGPGAAFEYFASSHQMIVLYEFLGGSDGAYPWASLTFGSKGRLFGTTSGGGAYGLGTVFEVIP
jgi:uncharacterized repeat protein (TIGR03803 family)